MALEYLSTGTANSNETIVCTTAATIDGTGLFMGRTSGLAANSVLGLTGTYGAWTGSAKTGTRLDVIATGVPGTVAEVLWDLQSGRVYGTTSRTVYGYSWVYADLQNEGRIFNATAPFTLSASAEDIYYTNCPWKVVWGEYQISVLGNRPTGTLDLSINSATGGAGWGATLTLDTGEGNLTSGFKTITGGFSMTTANLLVIRNSGTNGGFDNVVVTLREQLK